uniref:non-specific serine/threonine protein kinase n=1 Tax=Panagrellus redivivus TaxID=6233 RepID=A0A7E5A121_PANRE
MTKASFTYIFELPAKEIYDLSGILDSGGTWQDVALAMPGIADIDIDACRRSRDTSPTALLLRIWGSKGYTISDLYKVFARLKMVICMQIIRKYVSTPLHRLETDCLTLPDVPRSTLSESNSIHRQPTEHHTQPPSVNSVYSKKSDTSWASLAAVDSESSSQSSSVSTGLQNTLSVRYEEVLVATDNFSDKFILGKGGYGVVYKGEWKHMMVAVKRIQAKKDAGSAHEKERLRQSLQELRTLAKFRHDNILSLYGYSLDGPEPCLIYQFMANGSLEDRLLCRKSTPPLTWLTRFRIAQGVSCGLHFLHSINTAPLIHGDVKSANILLDKHMEPKLGDFGLCRDGQQEFGIDEKSPLIASHIKGTLAYLPPEFISSKILTTKLDVYSFGIMMLEIFSGLRAYSDSREPHALVDYVRKLVQATAKDAGTTILEALADKKMEPREYTDAEFEAVLDIGLRCAHKDRLARPSFSDIVMKLNNIAKHAVWG